MKEVGKGMVEVSYERTFSAKPVLTPLLEACPEGMLFSPERGTTTKSRTLSKQSDGTWEVAKDSFGSAHTL